MKPTLCSRCGKNVAVVFITKIENGKSTNEGLCLKCAKELGIKQVDDMVKQMGISDEDIDSISGEMMSMLGGDPNQDGDEDDELAGQTATFPFLNKLFGGLAAQNNNAEPPAKKQEICRITSRATCFVTSAARRPSRLRLTASTTDITTSLYRMISSV